MGRTTDCHKPEKGCRSRRYKRLQIVVLSLFISACNSDSPLEEKASDTHFDSVQNDVPSNQPLDNQPIQPVTENEQVLETPEGQDSSSPKLNMAMSSELSIYENVKEVSELAAKTNSGMVEDVSFQLSGADAHLFEVVNEKLQFKKPPNFENPFCQGDTEAEKRRCSLNITPVNNGQVGESQFVQVSINDVSYHSNESDQDGDGLADEIDPFPSTPTALSAPILNSNDTLELTRVVTEIQQNSIDNHLVDGKTVTLIGNGFQDYGRDVWVVFETEDGAQAVVTDVIDAKQLRVKVPQVKTFSVRVVTSEWHSNSVSVGWLEESQPKIFNPDRQNYLVGEQVTLAGENLADIESILIGDAQVDVVDQSDNSISFILPEFPSSNFVFVKSSEFLSNAIELNFSKIIQVSVDVEEGILKQDDEITLLGGQSVAVLKAPEFDGELQVSAVLPEAIIASIQAVNGERFSDQLRSVIWPDQVNTTLSAKSTVEAAIYNKLAYFLRQSRYSGLKKQTWSRLVADESVEEFATLYANTIRNSNTFPGGLNSELKKLYRNLESVDLVVTQNQIKTPANFVSEYDPDSVIVTTEQPIVSAKSSYNSFEVGNGESVCKTFSLSDPVGSLPSDLSASAVCVKNHSNLFASVIGVKDKQHSIQYGTHISSVLDTNILGNVSGYAEYASVAYPKNQSGKYLCNLESCDYEVLTGGLGEFVGSGSGLSKNQQTVADILKLRTITELFVLPALKEFTGISVENLSKGQCGLAVYDLVKNSSGGLSAGVVNLIRSINTVGDSEQALDQLINTTLGHELYQKLSDPVKVADLVLACKKTAVEEDIKKVVEDHIKGALKLGQVVTLSIDAFKSIKKAIEITGPERIVFDIKYGALVDEFDSEIDLVLDQKDESGDHVYLSFCGNNLNGGDDNNPHYPTLRIDASNKSLEVALQSDYLTQSVCDDKGFYSQRKGYIVPVSTAELSNMQAPVKLTLLFGDKTYSDYPNNKLPIPFPKTLTILNGAEKVDVPEKLKAGTSLTITGSRFASVYSEGVEIFLVSTGPVSGNYYLESPSVQSDNQITARVPSNVPTGPYTLFLAPTGYSKNQASEDFVVTKDVEVSLSSDVVLSIADTGSYKDDSLKVTFFVNDFEGSEIVQSLPQGDNYSMRFAWNPLLEGQNIPSFQVECTDAGQKTGNGNADVCTFSLYMQGSNFYEDPDCNGQAIYSYSGVLPETEIVDFSIGSITGSGCQE